MKNIYLLIGLLSVALMAGCGKTQTEVAFLKVEMQENPQGVAATHPRFSWQIRSALSDVVQLSYQIQVASSENDLKKEQNLLWDSGVVESDLSVFIPYAGEKLLSRKPYFWRVKVTTNKGETAWSNTGHWNMALLDKAEWQARWIGEDSLSNP